jgi:hypothetical protein
MAASESTKRCLTPGNYSQALRKVSTQKEINCAGFLSVQWGGLATHYMLGCSLHLMKLILRASLTILSLAVGAIAQESFKYRCPKGDAILPASCLENMKVANVNRQLNSAERHQLAYLFAKSYVVSTVRYHQDYYVNPNAPILWLMMTNFPEFKDPLREGGIWLQDIFNFFKSQSRYRMDVEKSISGLSAKQRKKFVS